MSEMYNEVHIVLTTPKTAEQEVNEILNASLSTTKEPEPIVNEIMMVLTFQRD